MIGSRNLWGGNASSQSGRQSRLVVLQVGGSSSITWGISFKMAVLMIITASTGHSLSHRQLAGEHQSPFTIHIQTAAAGHIDRTRLDVLEASWAQKFAKRGHSEVAPSDSVVHHWPEARRHLGRTSDDQCTTTAGVACDHEQPSLCHSNSGHPSSLAPWIQHTSSADNTLAADSPPCWTWRSL